MLSMGALMFQIQVKAWSCAAFLFGFRLGCLESMLRSVLNPCTKLNQSVLKKQSVFPSKGKTTGWFVDIIGCLSLNWLKGFETVFWIGYVTIWPTQPVKYVFS